jgi:hypothetical protein
MSDNYRSSNERSLGAYSPRGARNEMVLKMTVEEEEEEEE